MTNHMWSAYHFLGNMDAWKALPGDIQGTVERNLTKCALLQRADTARLNASLADGLVQKGMIRNDAEPASFRTKLSESGFYHKWKDAFGPEAWALLEANSGKLA